MIGPPCRDPMGSGRTAVRRARRVAMVTVLVTFALAVVVFTCLTEQVDTPDSRSDHHALTHHGRVLLSSSAVTPGGGGGGGGEVWQPDPGDPSSLLPNCTPPAIEQFPPPPFFTPSQRRRGGVVVHALVACYMFVALALACDDYFVPACERLSDVLKLQNDVAGATFMAAGSSAPELATAVIGVFVAKDDIGLGAVVGSAVFNIMLVTSICALFAGSVVYLRWWPLARDCTFYTISIIALVLVIYDEAVYWYEAAALLLLYSFYIVVMVFNRPLEKFFVSRSTLYCRHTPDDEKSLVQLTSVRPLSEDASSPDDAGSSADSAIEFDSLLDHYSDLEDPRVSTGTAGGQPNDQNDLTEVVDDRSTLAMPDHACRRLFWLVCLPLSLVLFFTVPDCRSRRWRRWYMLTFVMSIVWIAAFSYVMVWMITIVGHTFHIPDTIMGLTFIAAGASVPDAIASLLVVRAGHGDMAISNAIGSNVFDILVCLGLPWLISTLGYSPNGVVEVYSAGLTYSALTLLGTVVFLVVATHCNGWRLTRSYGVILLVVYVFFNVLASLYELNVFGFVHPPDCLSIY